VQFILSYQGVDASRAVKPHLDNNLWVGRVGVKLAAERFDAL